MEQRTFQKNHAPWVWGRQRAGSQRQHARPLCRANLAAVTPRPTSTTPQTTSARPPVLPLVPLHSRLPSPTPQSASARCSSICVCLQTPTAGRSLQSRRWGGRGRSRGLKWCWLHVLQVLLVPPRQPPITLPVGFLLCLTQWNVIRGFGRMSVTPRLLLAHIFLDAAHSRLLKFQFFLKGLCTKRPFSWCDTSVFFLKNFGGLYLLLFPSSRQRLFLCLPVCRPFPFRSLNPSSPLPPPIPSLSSSPLLAFFLSFSMAPLQPHR